MRAVIQDPQGLELGIVAPCSQGCPCMRFSQQLDLCLDARATALGPRDITCLIAALSLEGSERAKQFTAISRSLGLPL